MKTKTGVFRAGLFAGKTAIVSGGGSGIGFDVARQLFGLGANVVLASRDEAKLDAAAFQRDKKMRAEMTGLRTKMTTRWPLCSGGMPACSRRPCGCARVTIGAGGSCLSPTPRTQLPS